MTDGLVVVGGGPAGHSAAIAYRDAGGSGPVRLLSADTAAPYNRPPLTKDYLRGEAEEDDLPLAGDSAYAERDIDVRLERRVIHINPIARELTTHTGDRIVYDTCIWAAGSQPTPLPVPGADDPDVLSLRFLDDGRRLRDRATRAGSAIVIGSGFIGCEAAASLAMRGLDVTVISTEAAPQRGRLGQVVSERLSGWLRGHGVRLVLGAGVDSIDDACTVRLDDGSTSTADLVLVATGIQPQSEVLAEAGVPVESQRVVVDEHMRTTVPGLYAAGDVALAFNPAAGRRLPIEHWGEALAMGEVAGSCAAGGDAAWQSVPGFWTQIGHRTLKYAAWGDGFDDLRLVEHDDDAFTVWYGSGGSMVGVLTHQADDDYDRGSDLVLRGASFPGDLPGKAQ